jgi:hypothetical protein
MKVFWNNKNHLCWRTYSLTDQILKNEFPATIAEAYRKEDLSKTFL